jgi:hypothetical protein
MGREHVVSEIHMAEDGCLIAAGLNGWAITLTPEVMVEVAR